MKAVYNSNMVVIDPEPLEVYTGSEASYASDFVLREEQLLQAMKAIKAANYFYEVICDP